MPLRSYVRGRYLLGEWLTYQFLFDHSFHVLNLWDKSLQLVTTKNKLKAILQSQPVLLIQMAQESQVTGSPKWILFGLILCCYRFPCLLLSAQQHQLWLQRPGLLGVSLSDPLQIKHAKHLVSCNPALFPKKHLRKWFLWRKMLWLIFLHLVSSVLEENLQVGGMMIQTEFKLSV